MGRDIDIVNRYIGYGSLLLLIGWLVLSYGAWLPDRINIAVPLALVSGWFQQATVVILLLFVSIQLWLLRSTFRMLHRRQQTGGQSMSTSFTLGMWSEIFWTAMPILFTVGLAVAGYKLWANM